MEQSYNNLCSIYIYYFIVHTVYIINISVYIASGECLDVYCYIHVDTKVDKVDKVLVSKRVTCNLYPGSHIFPDFFNGNIYIYYLLFVLDVHQ